MGSRLHRGLLLALAAIACGLAVALFVSSAEVYRLALESARYETATGWPIVQARLELERLRSALLRCAADAAETVDVDRRLAIFESRVPLLTTERDVRVAWRGVTVETARAELARLVPEAARLARACAEEGRRDPGGFSARVDGLFEPAAAQLHRLLVGFAHWRAALFDDASRSLGRVRVWMALSLAGFAVVAGGLFALLWSKAAALERNERRFRDFTASASDWVWELDAAGRIAALSEHVRETFGVPPARLRGRSVLRLPWVAPREARSRLAAALEARRPFRDLPLAIRGPGGVRHFRLSGVPVFDRRGRLEGYRGVARDVTEQVLGEARIHFLARHDPLTGLLNRNTFLEALEARFVDGGARAAGTTLLLVDLDGFKAVNDRYGHRAGDELLVRVAERLRGCVRGSDLVARLGGDEFAVLLAEGDAGGMRRAEAVADRIVAELGRPFALGRGLCTRIGATVGIAVAPEDGATATALLEAADLALYRGKAQGRARAVRFRTGMRERANRRLQLRERLERAVEDGALDVHFQPIVDLVTFEVRGVEALARWTDAVLGPVSPAEFVQLAEEEGLIVALGRVVLRRAFAEGTRLPDPVRVGVNVSPLQLARSDFAGDLADVLRSTGFPARRVVMEITESTLMSTDRHVRDQLARLRAMGVAIAMDDFGSGYSSLSHLRRLPVDRIKLDRSFARDLGRDPVAATMIGAVVDIARALGLPVIAEGIETPEQLKQLRALGVDAGQGWLFGRPLPAGEAVRRLGEAPRGPAGLPLVTPGEPAPATASRTRPALAGVDGRTLSP